MSTFSRAINEARTDYRHESDFAADMHRKSVHFRERNLPVLAGSYQLIAREAFIRASFAREILERLLKKA